MIKIDIEDKTYEVPNNWDDISLGDFQKLSLINTEAGLYTIIIERLKILTTIPIDIINQISMDSIQPIIEILSFLGKAPTDEVKDKTIITINGEKFGMVQNLNELSIGEWADMEYYLGITEKGDNKFAEYHNILSVFVRPILNEYEKYDVKLYDIEKYEGKDHTIRANYFQKYMKADDAQRLMGFFLRLEANFILNTMNSLMETEKMKKIKGLSLKNIQKVLDG